MTGVTPINVSQTKPFAFFSHMASQEERVTTVLVVYLGVPEQFQFGGFFTKIRVEGGGSPTAAESIPGRRDFQTRPAMPETYRTIVADDKFRLKFAS
jgi:hypothetical protein